MFENNVCPLLIRIVRNMYLLNSGKIKWNNVTTDSFRMSNGCKQGAILSPFLFNLYLKPLIRKINESGFGCYIGNKPANIFSYADDIVILAPTVTSLRYITNLVEEYSTNFSLNFNPNKSFILLYSNNLSSNDINVFINGQKIDFLTSCKHLGFNIVNNNQIYDIQSVINDMCIKTNILKSNFHSLSSDSKIKLFNSHCLSLYGSELWNLENNSLKRLEINWKKCIKCLLGLPMRTRSHLIPHIVGTPSIFKIIENRQINFIKKGLNEGSEFTKFIFKNALLYNRSYLTRNVNKILIGNNLTYLDIFSGNRVRFKTVCEENWRVQLIEDLMHKRDFKLYDDFNAMEIDIFLKYICCF